MESVLVGMFCFCAIVSEISYLIELHNRNKREDELRELHGMNYQKFIEWKNGKGKRWKKDVNNKGRV